MNKISFFQPTYQKLAFPAVFFFLPVLNYICYPLPYLGIYMMLFSLSLCVPFYPLLGQLGLLQWTMGLIGRQQTTTFFGLMLVMLIYSIVFYLLICIAFYVKAKYPNSIWTKKW